MDRRALFFLGAAAAALLLVPVLEGELSWVPRVVSVTYVLLAIGSWLDWRSSQRPS